MFDDVKLANEDEVIAYVERSIREAAPDARFGRSQYQNGELLAWTVFPANSPDWSAGYSLLALHSGEMFFFVHDNHRVGLFSLEHATSRARIIYRFAFGAWIDREEFSLASALKHLLATTGPNRESPT